VVVFTAVAEEAFTAEAKVAGEGDVDLSLPLRTSCPDVLGQRIERPYVHDEV
jgi:hypothetical protein